MGKVTKAGLRGRVKLALRKSIDGQTFFVLVAGNGEVMATSETYSRPGNAFRAAQRFREVVDEAVIEDERA